MSLLAGIALGVTVATAGPMPTRPNTPFPIPSAPITHALRRETPSVVPTNKHLNLLQEMGFQVYQIVTGGAQKKGPQKSNYGIEKI